MTNYNGKRISYSFPYIYYIWGLSRWCSGKNPPAYVGDVGSIPGLGRSPGERNGNPLQYSCLENSMDRGAWQTAVHRVTESWTRLSNWQHMEYTHTHTHTYIHICITESLCCIAEINTTLLSQLYFNKIKNKRSWGKQEVKNVKFIQLSVIYLLKT